MYTVSLRRSLAPLAAWSLLAALAASPASAEDTAAEPEPGFRLYLDLGGGFSSLDADSSVTGHLATATTGAPGRSVPAGLSGLLYSGGLVQSWPGFAWQPTSRTSSGLSGLYSSFDGSTFLLPGSIALLAPLATSYPFELESGDDVEGAFGVARLGVMGPPCGPCGLRPAFSVAVPFHSIASTLIDAPIEGTEWSAHLRARRYFFQATAGAAWEGPWGLTLEGALAYQVDRIRLDARFHFGMSPIFLPMDFEERETFFVHSLGPRFQVTKRLLRWGRFELGVYLGGDVLWAVGNRGQTIRIMGSDGSLAEFAFDAGMQWSAGGGLRLAFDLPGL